MRVIIIEDEILAQSKLESMLKAIDPSIEVLAKLCSVKESIEFLSHHPSPDLAFVDIQLSDDHSFEIFRNNPPQCPVIFTTAYDKYLLESFEYNAIDYLLKPFSEEKLRRALTKIKKLEWHFIQGSMQKLVSAKQGKDRMIVRKGTEYVALTWTEIAYFFTEHKIVFVKDFSGRQYLVDKNLSMLETDLDEKRFFRVNRKFIANLDAIEKFKPDNGKIRIFLKPEMKEEIHVSKETAPLFRRWIGVG